MNASCENNEKWDTCLKCSEPVPVNPTTGDAEPCSTCASHASKEVGVMGVGLLIAGIAAGIALVYVCIRLL